MVNVNFLPVDSSQPSDIKVVGDKVDDGGKDKSEVFSDLMEQHKSKEKNGNSCVESGNESHEPSQKQQVTTDESTHSKIVESESLEVKKTDDTDLETNHHTQVSTDAEQEFTQTPNINQDSSSENKINNQPDELLLFLSASGSMSTQLAAQNALNDTEQAVSDKSDIELLKSGEIKSDLGLDTKTSDSVESDKSTETDDLLSLVVKKNGQEEIGQEKTDNAKYQGTREQLTKVSTLSAAIRMAANPEKQSLEVSLKQKDEMMNKFIDTNSIPGEIPEDPQHSTKVLVDDTLINSKLQVSPTAVEQANNIDVDEDVSDNEVSKSIQLNNVIDKNIAQSTNTLNNNAKPFVQSTADVLAQTQKGSDGQLHKQDNPIVNVTETKDDETVFDVIAVENEGVKTEAKSMVNSLFSSSLDSLSQREATNTTRQVNQQEQYERSFENVMNTLSTETIQTQKHTVHQAEVISIMHKDFNNAVKEKIMVMIQQKIQQVDIQLDPPEFGNMQVRVNLQNEQAVVSFIVQNQQAKEALEQNMDKLKQMMADRGVDVGEANVKQQSNQSADENTQEQRTNNTQGEMSDSGIEQQVDLNSLNVLKASSTGVDYYA